ncbi:MAG: type IV pilus twitching motility protein PilT [Candidatus Eremiobacteraeota bacterium]|nr:type IV pilus twitching motility protein PilT [Candidatus Eremiobacteraeota bacterium]
MGRKSGETLDEEISIEDLMYIMVERGASDLHIKTGSAPMIRIDGELTPAIYDVLTPDQVRLMVESILTDEQKAKFVAEKELDLAYSVPGLSRFRINIYLQRGTWGTAIRVIPARPFSIDELKLPSILKDLSMKPRGLILVTGPTGSGKSTTLAAMINHINENRRCHIVTVEDPIEFLHKDKNSVICQREVGSDTYSFANALRHVLRQDPDVILIGEMRDLDTAQIAITAAETGHLVLATLHTNSAASTVDRIIDIFPPHQQQQIRMQLSVTLAGIICQTLIPRAEGSGRVLAMELMPVNPAVRNIIREGKTYQIPNVIQAGKDFGMQSLDMCLRDLYKKGLITYEDALSKAAVPDEFRRLVDEMNKSR